MNKYLTFFTTCPKGIEEILYHELMSLGVRWAKQTRSGVHFKADLSTAYRVCLWSRLAGRVLLALVHLKAKTPDELYEKVYSMVNWDDHMQVSGTLAVDFAQAGHKKFHTHYAALRIKDAIVDQFNGRFGKRPSINTDRPDLRVNVFMKHENATVYLDLSGESLHKRGYRGEGGIAPLKENLAAAILFRSGWPELAGKGLPLIDPMCGSGTLLIEGAMMALDMAPGLGREHFGFIGWKGHDESAWHNLMREAKERAENVAEVMFPRLYGFDSDKGIIKQARANAGHAGLKRFIKFECLDVDALKAPESSTSGLVVTNPPYGRRMGERKSLEPLYRCLGDRLKTNFSGWHASVFTGNPDLAKHMGIRAKKKYTFYNGALSCKLLNFEIRESWYMHKKSPDPHLPAQAGKPVLDAGAEMFANRLKKNLKNIGKWAGREGISCYRLYDADMPEYAVAIDIYNDRVHVQEYEAPTGILPENASRRLKQILSVLPGVLRTPPDKIVLKVRKRKRGKEQYQRFDTSGRFFQVQENGLQFLVNLTDYLDTGLFLDQRIVRQRIRDYSAGKSMLNLFCYTGTATVYAAAGKAGQTTSVDLSRKYLSWAERNLILNGFDTGSHKLVQADCLEWIKECKERYDLIFLAPPTFSNSKKMKYSFDIQRDHAGLLNQVLNLLSSDGLLIFSCNMRRFKLNSETLTGRDIQEISGETIPRDFKRSAGIHHCFEIR